MPATATKKLENKLTYCELEDGKLRLLAASESVVQSLGRQLQQKGFSLHSESSDGREIAKWTDKEHSKHYVSLCVSHSDPTQLKKLTDFLNKNGAVEYETVVAAKRPPQLKDYAEFKKFHGQPSENKSAASILEDDFESIIPSPTELKKPVKDSHPPSEKKEIEEAAASPAPQETKKTSLLSRWLKQPVTWAAMALSAMGLGGGLAALRGCEKPSPIASAVVQPVVTMEDFSTILNAVKFDPRLKDPEQKKSLEDIIRRMHREGKSARNMLETLRDKGGADHIAMIGDSLTEEEKATATPAQLMEGTSCPFAKVAATEDWKKSMHENANRVRAGFGGDKSR